MTYTPLLLTTHPGLGRVLPGLGRVLPGLARELPGSGREHLNLSGYLDLSAVLPERYLVRQLTPSMISHGAVVSCMC